MSIDNLKPDIIKMLELTAEIARNEQKTLYHNEITNKRLYNPSLVNKLRIKIENDTQYLDLLKRRWL